MIQSKKNLLESSNLPDDDSSKVSQLELPTSTKPRRLLLLQLNVEKYGKNHDICTFYFRYFCPFCTAMNEWMMVQKQQQQHYSRAARLSFKPDTIDMRAGVGRSTGRWSFAAAAAAAPGDGRQSDNER